MQGIPSIGDGGGGQLFGSGGGPDRRLRPLQHQTSTKCPRCDSPDTKFCYYNNYNLSQPRHFCRTCKRYWTYGGLLRNVPVGGGCRKPKRSKPKPSGEEDRKANSPSSTDSSSLTLATTASAAFTAEVASSASTLLDFPDSSLFGGRQNSNPRFHPPLTDPSTDGGVLTEIGSLPSVMTSSGDPSLLGLNTTGVSAPAYRLHQQSQGTFLENQSSNQKIAGYMPKDPTAQIDLSGQYDKANNCGVGAPDWGAGGDQRLIDFTRTLDQAYWSQSQWTEAVVPVPRYSVYS